MATLRVALADVSATKRKAMEDAKEMQDVIVRESAETGKEPPPYILSELIGKGSFGRVYKAQATESGKLVAIKIISIDEGDSLAPGAADTLNDILKEVNTLKKLGESGAKNVNVVVDTLLVSHSMWMVTEYCAGGSVSTLMRPSGGLPNKWIIPILREVAEALFWVHKEGIIHRDIKCANVLVTEMGTVQLCDFGVAGIIETKYSKRSTVTGTLNWMPPELFDASVSYGTEVDIWAFGSLAYEVATGLPPNAKNMSNIDIPQFGSYLKRNCPRLEGDQYADGLKDLVAFCMVEDPQDRPTIEQIQQHSYLWNTGDKFPTESLSMLVKAYRLWETQGGHRVSLFNPGGAQGLVGNRSTLSLNDDVEWDFNTVKVDMNEALDEEDANIVSDVYGVDVPQPLAQAKLRRRRPPNIRALTAPLEKAFDPNTMTSYLDAAHVFYGKGMPLSAPVFPDENTSKQDPARAEMPRESLIDLDMSLDGGRLSHYVDMNMEMDTMKPMSARLKHETYRESGLIDLDMSFADLRTIRASTRLDPIDQADLERRRTQEWTFPSESENEPQEWTFDSSTSQSALAAPQDWRFSSAIASASAATAPQDWRFSSAIASAPLEGQWFQGDEDDGYVEDDYMSIKENTDPWSPDHRQQPAQQASSNPDPWNPEHRHQSSQQASSNPDLSRLSALSLIDLDASYAVETGLRPSSAMSDATSAMSDFWNPLAAHHQQAPSEQFNEDYFPTTNREPSMYVPDDLVPNNREPSMYASDDFPTAIREPSMFISDELAATLKQPSDDRPSNNREPSIYVPDDLGHGGAPSTPISDNIIILTPPSEPNEPQDVPMIQAPDAPPMPSLRIGSGVDSQQQSQRMPPLQVPYMPRPPSENVMQGTTSREEVKDEMQRLIRSLSQHLQYTASVVGMIPPNHRQAEQPHML